MSMFVSIASTISRMEADNNLATAPVEAPVVEVRTPVRTTVATALRKVAELQLRLAARLDDRRFTGRHAVASL